MSAPPDLAPGLGRGEAVRRIRAALAAAGLADAALEARILVMDALGVGAADLAREPEAPLGAAAGPLAAWTARRLDREPLARILGEREFWGLAFRLSPGTLVPRPDTETLVAAALALHPDRAAGFTVLDLGTGSGCLLVAILSERPRAWGLGVDRAPDALRTARGNAARNGVGPRAAFLAGDWTAPLHGRFDLIVSNPPYIPSEEIGQLAPEVRLHDPRAALDGGADGLGAYRALLATAGRVLAPGGRLVLELGRGQDGPVSRIAEGLGWRVADLAPDLAGIPRALTLAREA